MLRASIKQCGNRLAAGIAQSRSGFASVARTQTGACLSSSRRPLAVTPKAAISRSYAVAVEKTNKGVVWLSAVAMLCVVGHKLMHRACRIPMIPSFKATPQTMSTKCTWPGRRIQRACTSPGKSISATWSQVTCPCRKPSKHRRISFLAQKAALLPLRLDKQAPSPTTTAF